MAYAPAGYPPFCLAGGVGLRWRQAQRPHAARLDLQPYGSSASSPSRWRTLKARCMSLRRSGSPRTCWRRSRHRGARARHADPCCGRVGEKDLGIAAAQELGKQREVGAVFAGHLKVTNPKGTGGLAGLVTPHLEATVRVDLTVRLLSTRSGATLWRRVPGRPSESVMSPWWVASSTSPPRIPRRRTDRW